MTEGFSPLEGFTVDGGATKSRQDHLYDDVDSGPEAHHHTIGNGPDQATSLPLAKQVFDDTYAFQQHTHPEIAGDNLILNGDASSGITNWTISTINGSGSVSAGDFLSQLSVDTSEVVWQSNVFTPVANEDMAGNITYRGDTLSTRLRVYVAWRADTTDPSVDTALTPDAGTTLEFIGQRSITAVNADQVWAFSWLVPPTALRGRLVIVWDDDTVAAGFPLNCYHDDVQLVSNLTTVSKLYVGVTSPQRMEGPLTVEGAVSAAALDTTQVNADTANITNLFLPTGNQGVGKVLVSDASGQADWGYTVPLYVGPSAPSNPAQGQLWWDTSTDEYEEFHVLYGNNSATAFTVNGTWVDIALETVRIDFPCRGMFFMDYSCMLHTGNVANKLIAYKPAVKSYSNLTPYGFWGGVDMNQARTWSEASEKDEIVLGKYVLQVYNVGVGGGSVEFKHMGYATSGAGGGSGIYVNFIRFIGRFVPYGDLRTMTLGVV
jgi:hypothetical protein